MHYLLEGLKPKTFTSFLVILQYDSNILPTAEILSGKNTRAFLVCGFLMKSFKKYPENMKKIVGAIWKLPAK